MENTKATSPQVKAAVGIIAALTEAIRALGSIPSGHLYAQVMGSIDLDTYTRLWKRDEKGLGWRAVPNIQMWGEVGADGEPDFSRMAPMKAE